MNVLANLVRVSTATIGTGTLTLGAAVAGWLTFAQAGVSSGAVVTYAIEDANGGHEIGQGTYTLAGLTLTRGLIYRSTGAGNNTAISLSGSAHVYITPAAEDFMAIPLGSITGLGAGVSTFLATPSSANLLAAVTDETGTGALVFANSPVLAGNPTAPTPALSDSDTSIATTAYVKGQLYTTGNDTITLSGDIAGTGTTAIATTLATVLSTPGTFQGLTINNKGLVTAAVNQGYISGNQSITISGDADGTGTTAITLTLDTVNSNVGTFQGLTVNGKGLVTAATNQNYATTAALAGYLPLTGGTLSGDLTVAVTAGSDVTIGNVSITNNATLNLTAGAGYASMIAFNGGATASRWFMSRNNTAEGGSNAGSDFNLSRYSDAPAFLDYAIVIQRATGNFGLGLDVAQLPQAKLHIGRTAATARTYNSYTDASNSAWAYLGDWGKTSNVATFGTDKNGAGGNWPMALMSGGIEAARITTAGEITVNSTATPIGLFTVGGTYTNVSNPYAVHVSTTVASSAATQQATILARNTITPTAATGTVYGLYGDITLGAATFTVGAFNGVAVRHTFTAGRTGVVTALAGFAVQDPILNGNTPIVTFNAFQTAPITHGNGATSGGVNNRGLFVDAMTAGSAGSATSNRAAMLTVPSGGSSAGSTTNVGVYISGNGGTAAGGSVQNWAIFSNSTAESWFSGAIRMQGTAAIIQKPAASVTPTTNGELTVEATSNTTLTFRFRGSDSVTRAVALTLA